MGRNVQAGPRLEDGRQGWLERLSERFQKSGGRERESAGLKVIIGVTRK